MVGGHIRFLKMYLKFITVQTGKLIHDPVFYKTINFNHHHPSSRYMYKTNRNSCAPFDLKYMRHLVSTNSRTQHSHELCSCPERRVVLCYVAYCNSTFVSEPLNSNNERRLATSNERLLLMLVPTACALNIICN